jgi:protein TonB
VQYPDFEKRAGLEGTVVVRFVVTPDGRAEDIAVARGVSPGLDAAAIAGVRRQRFTPGRQNGQPVRVRLAVPVRFVLR